MFLHMSEALQHSTNQNFPITDISWGKQLQSARDQKAYIERNMHRREGNLSQYRVTKDIATQLKQSHQNPIWEPQTSRTIAQKTDHKSKTGAETKRDSPRRRYFSFAGSLSFSSSLAISPSLRPSLPLKSLSGIVMACSASP